MDITFKGRHTTVPERFRRHATEKLARLERLDHNAIRIDVEVSTERNPRQTDHSERVELTIRSRGPAIRAEAAADDRYAALDLAFAKLEGRLRKAAERRKVRHGDQSVRSAGVLSSVTAGAAGQESVGSVQFAATPVSAAAGAVLRSGSAGAPPAVPVPEDGAVMPNGTRIRRKPNGPRRPETVVQLPSDEGGFTGRDFAGFRDEAEAEEAFSGVLPIPMEGDGPLVVREKFHASKPMTIDQALLEMELVGHDFYAYHDRQCGKFSVVYRRRGYDYGVIRLEDSRGD